MTSTPRRPVSDLVAMTKPGIASMVLVTTGVGFVLASTGPFAWPAFLAGLAGVALAGSASSVLNQVMEVDFDRLMLRTRRRPLPAGRLSIRTATWFGVGLGAGGIVMLALWTNALTAGLTAATLLSYLFIYTPLKRRTPLNTIAGAFPGAMPPLLGWTAASGHIEAGGLALFGILFLWQLPHFLAIAWLYREDYVRGGFRMLTYYDPDGRMTGRHMVLHCVSLVVASLVPVALGLAGALYVVGALVVGAVFLLSAIQFWRQRSQTSARLAMAASLAYLPVVFGLLVTGL